jgi:hypothetical protein
MKGTIGKFQSTTQLRPQSVLSFEGFWHSLPEDSIPLRFDASSLRNRIPTFRRKVLAFLSRVNTARLQAVIIFDTSVSDYPLKQYDILEDLYT